MRNVFLQDWGLIDYELAFTKQEKLMKTMIDFKTQYQKNSPHDYLIFCMHPHVYTLGKGGDEKNLLISKDEMLSQNIQFFHTNRGGDITYHGPDQIVVYPIFDLEAHKPDIGLYIKNLEEVIIKTLKHFNIQACCNKGEIGVWIDADVPTKARKICAIGVRCSRWVTMHGLALNVNTDLKYFSNIIPCGIIDKKVSSLELEMKKKIDLEYVKKLILNEFKVIFNLSYK